MFQSTRPVRGATSVSSLKSYEAIVSIHAPRAGRDGVAALICFIKNLFQSTRPVRGATQPNRQREGWVRFQSTRPVRGATMAERICSQCGTVSIHAPRAGRDDEYDDDGGYERLFQSTRPVRGATSEHASVHQRWWFQSTRPVRGATSRIPSMSLFCLFQSTRPVRGATCVY